MEVAYLNIRKSQSFLREGANHRVCSGSGATVLSPCSLQARVTPLGPMRRIPHCSLRQYVPLVCVRWFLPIRMGVVYCRDLECVREFRMSHPLPGIRMICADFETLVPRDGLVVVSK